MSHLLMWQFGNQKSTRLQVNSGSESLLKLRISFIKWKSNGEDKKRVKFP